MFRIIDWIERLCSRIVYGPEDENSDPALMQALDRAFTLEPDPWFRDFQRKERLERELANAEWILRYEKRLAKLHAKTKTQRSRAEQVGTNTDRLRRLEHHLAGLRRNLSLD